MNCALICVPAINGIGGVKIVAQASAATFCVLVMFAPLFSNMKADSVPAVAPVEARIAYRPSLGMVKLMLVPDVLNVCSTPTYPVVRIAPILLFNEEIYPGFRIQIKINQKGGNHEQRHIRRSAD